MFSSNAAKPGFTVQHDCLIIRVAYLPSKGHNLELREACTVVSFLDFVLLVFIQRLVMKVFIPLRLLVFLLQTVESPSWDRVPDTLV